MPAINVAARLAHLRYDPALRLARIAMNPTTPLHVRVYSAAELLPYLPRKTKQPEPATALEKKLKRLGFDPVQFLVSVACDTAASAELRLAVLWRLSRDYVLGDGEAPTDPNLRALLRRQAKPPGNPPPARKSRGGLA